MTSRFLTHVLCGAMVITFGGASLLENDEDVAKPEKFQKEGEGTFGPLPDNPPAEKYWFEDLLEPEEDKPEDKTQNGKDVPRGRLCGWCVDHALPKDGKEGALFRMCTKKFGPNKGLCVIQSGRYDAKRPQFTDAAAGMCVPSPWGGEDKTWPDGKKRWCDADQGKWGDIQTGQVKACKDKKENDRCRFVTPGILQNEDGSYYCTNNNCNNGRCEYGTLNGVTASHLWCNIWNPECAIHKETCKIKDPNPARRRSTRRRPSRRRQSSRRRTRRRRRSKPARRRRGNSTRRRSKKA